MADNDDLTPGSSGICSIGDDSMTDGIDGISQVTVPFAYSVPIFSEMAGTFQTQSAGTVISIGIGFSDREVKAIAKRDISPFVGSFCHEDGFRFRCEKGTENQNKDIE